MFFAKKVILTVFRSTAVHSGLKDRVVFFASGKKSPALGQRPSLTPDGRLRFSADKGSKDASRLKRRDPSHILLR